MSDRRVARILRRMVDLPGEELFHYVDEEGEARTIQSSDVNDYLRDTTGQDFTAKDFRTWAGTVLAARALQEYPRFSGKTEARRNVTTAIAAVAGVLGNTRAVCRKCYVHPEIVAAYLEGVLAAELLAQADSTPETGLRSEEAATLRLLEARLARSEPGERKPPAGRKRRAAAGQRPLVSRRAAVAVKPA